MGVDNFCSLTIDESSSFPTLNNNNNNNKIHQIVKDEIHIEDIISVPFRKLIGFSNILPLKLSHLFSTSEFETIINRINQEIKSQDVKSKPLCIHSILVLIYLFFGLGISFAIAFLTSFVFTTFVIYFLLLISNMIFLILRSNLLYKQGIINVNQLIITINNNLVNRNIEFTFYEKKNTRYISQHLKVSYPALLVQDNTITLPLQQDQQQKPQQYQQTSNHTSPLIQSGFSYYNQTQLTNNNNNNNNSATNISIDINELNTKQ